MKKVTAFIGTQQKHATYEAVREFEKNIKTYAEIDFEYVFLKDYRLENCKGCKLCFDKGEQNCPLQDDRDLLLQKLQNSDGVIMACPNYAFHVPAAMKNLFDRLAFVFHRPRFFGKTFTSIVTQGIYGGGAIVKYLDGMGENFGFNVAKGCVLKTLEPTPEAVHKKNLNEIRKISARFYSELIRPAFPAPSFFRLMLFRMSRTGIQLLAQKYYDHSYYKEKGWFESDYYYNTSMGPLKRVAGHLFDFLGRRMVKNS